VVQPTYIFGLLHNVESYHEPEPNYVSVMRESQNDSAVAERFLLQEKIPHLLENVSKPVYIETSHLFCKGLLDCWLNTSSLPTPDLIILMRPARSVAKSMLELDTVPGKTKRGLRWYLSPEDYSNITELRDWHSLNDYQLCYWYCHYCPVKNR